MHHILTNPRVLAYPCLVREFDTVGLQRENEPQGEDIHPRDSIEIMQSCHLCDAKGDLIGSLVNHENLRYITNYLKKRSNQGLAFYMDNMIREVPSFNAYDAFITAYKQNF